VRCLEIFLFLPFWNVCIVGPLIYCVEFADVVLLFCSANITMMPLLNLERLFVMTLLSDGVVTVGAGVVDAVTGTVELPLGIGVVLEYVVLCVTFIVLFAGLLLPIVLLLLCGDPLCRCSRCCVWVNHCCVVVVVIVWVTLFAVVVVIPVAVILVRLYYRCLVCWCYCYC